MPIVRTYGCENCGHFTEVWLTMEQADDPPPECTHCANAQMAQQFKPVAINGSVSARANAIAEDIAAKDYGVADLKRDHREGSIPTVRYKDQGNAMQQAQVSSWGASGAMLETAVALGRQTRMASGGYSGVDTLQRMLKDGSQPDLIEISKKRAARVW